MTLIKIRNIKKEFYFFNGHKDAFLYHFGLSKLVGLKKLDKHIVLDGISIDIKKGERIAILGKNGAGKSTLLKIIAGFIKPSSGLIQINGNIAALFSIGGGVNENLSGRENIRKISLLYGISKDEIGEYCKDVIEFSELDNVIDNPVYTYSLGMKMRLQFAMATSIKANIIIVDEVLGAGDAYFINKSRKRLEEILKNNATLIMVTHSMKEVESFCTRALLLDHGKICKDGTPGEVIPHYLSTAKLHHGIENKDKVWTDVPLSLYPLFLEDRVNHIESQLYNVNFKEMLFQKRAIKYFSQLTTKPLLTSFSCKSLGKCKGVLHPGDKFRCNFVFSDNNAIGKIIVRFYNHDCICLGSFKKDFNIRGVIQREETELTLDPLIFGSGMYQISLSVLDYEDNPIELYPNIYSFQISFSNDSDPPMLHLPGQWDFGSGDIVESRISPRQ